MRFDLGEMVGIINYALPFVNHEKGISIPSNDVVGEIMDIHISTLSYVVRLSKKYVLTFSQDDLYELPGWMSTRNNLFHKFYVSGYAFYYVKDFESFINREEKRPSRYFLPTFEKCIYEAYRTDSSLKALEELNKREIERIMAEPIRIDADEKRIEEIKMMLNDKFGVVPEKFKYKKIIFSGPCTIILWKDGTKTIAKASSGREVFDPEKGVAICFMKRVLGETEGKKVLRKASKDYYDGLAREACRQLDEELKKAIFPLPLIHL